jgi:hyperosmotically inducible protein
MVRNTMIAVGVSLGLLAVPGFVTQGTAGGPAAAVERTVKHAGETTTREVTDSWLTLQTKLALLADERVRSADVHVTTQEGVIKLRGKVDSEAEQQAAGEIAGTIEGVREVSNQLTVGPQPHRTAVDRQDHQIVKDVKAELKSDGRLRRARIQVRADEGIVTLTGTAPSLETSVRASEAARRVSGVRAVRNELTL